MFGIEVVDAAFLPAALVALARFPAIQAPEPAPFLDRLTRGTQAYAQGKRSA